MSLNWKVPLVDLKAQYLSIKPEVDEAVRRVMNSGSYVMGTHVELFEQEWAEFCKAKFCVGVSSGTDALYLTLKAMCKGNVSVVTTPATFFATTQAIIQAGHFPAFTDINESGSLPTMDFGDRVAIPVHLYGLPGAWTGPYLIEDSAQAHGVPLSGVAACFSFYPTKNLGAFGQAGAVVTNNELLVLIIRELRTYGEKERFVHYRLSGNYRMDELQASILRAKLPFLRKWNEERREIAAAYRDLLADVEAITLPVNHPAHVYHIFAIRCESRDSLADYLAGAGIQTTVRYPVPMHLQPVLRYLQYREGDFPQAEAWARENLSLPIYPEMTLTQVEYVCDGIKEWVRKKG